MIRLRYKIFSLVAALSASTGTYAHAQSDAVNEAINARLMVGTFARLCAAADANPQDLRLRADERGWRIASPDNLGELAPVAENAWRASFGGGDGQSVPFTIYIEDGSDPIHLATCGLRYQGISFLNMVAALEASALFKKEWENEEGAIFCVSKYPMANRSHRIEVRLQDRVLQDGLVYILRNEDPDAGSCPHMMGGTDHSTLILGNWLREDEQDRVNDIKDEIEE